MSESSKLILGAALVAVGFGVATLLGPPQNYSQWQSPLRQTASQSQSIPPQSLQLRAGDENLSGSESSPTALSPPVRPTPQWLAPVSVELSDMQSSVQPTGLFSDQPDRYAQFASAKSDTSASPTVSERNIHATARPVYDVAQKNDVSQKFGPTQNARRPLQDYADSHWLEDAASEAGEQKHVVADGDTLAELADIYLGDSQREWEIYHNNRDVLNSPELLPIGAVLTIPARAPLEVAVEIAPKEPILEPVPASNPPPSVASNSVSSFAVNHQSGMSEIPLPSTSIYSNGAYSSEEPDLVPVKPVTASRLAPHAHLLTPIPVD